MGVNPDGSFSLFKYEFKNHYRLELQPVSTNEAKLVSFFRERAGIDASGEVWLSEIDKNEWTNTGLMHEKGLKATEIKCAGMLAAIVAQSNDNGSRQLLLSGREP